MEDTGDKKHAIFESTLELIKEHGFHGAPMSQVAKNAGVAAGTIYHYFESKEDLILALFDYNRERVSKVVELTLKAPGDYKQKFSNVWKSLYDFYLERPNVLIFFEQFVNSPFNVSKYPAHFRGLLFSFFSAGVKDGTFRPVKPEILLVLFMGSIASAAKLHLFKKVPLTKADLQGIVDILWQGTRKSTVK